MTKVAAVLVALFVVVTVMVTGATTALAAPGAVSGLTSASFSSGSFSFSWNPVKGIVGYAYVFDRSPGTSAGSTVALPAPPSFSRSQTVAAGTDPWQVVTGDFGNGKLDLAVVNHGSNNVNLLLGNGHGTFTAGTTYAVGTQPHGIAIGDFNGDGRPDLSTANWSDNTVSVLLATGAGTFAPKVDYPTGKNPHGIAVGNLGNGTLDLVVANASDNTVSVFIGNGDGTFQPRVNYPTGAHPEKIAIGDFNRDGKPDLAVINNVGNTVSILLGTGGGAFTPGDTYPTGTTPHWVASGDFGNGRLDLAVANWASNTISVYIGKGDGTFAAKVDYPVGVNPAAVEIADVNGDGIPDLVVSDHAGSVAVLLGKGNATFLAAQFTTTAVSPRFFATGDFNGDGAPDLALPLDTGTSVVVLLDTTNTTSPSTTLNANVDGAWYFHVAAVDVNGNPGPTTTREVVRDTTPPVTTDNAPSGWQNHAVTVTLSPSDSASGMTGGQAGTWYKLDNGSFTPGTSVQVGNGKHTLAYYSKDAAGNTEQTHSVAVEVDTTPPVTTDNAPSGWQDHAVTVALSATDSGFGMSGGQAGTWYSLDGGTATEGASVRVSGDGKHTLAYHSKDAGGNTEQTHSATVDIDMTGPRTWALKAITVKAGKVAKFVFRVNDLTRRVQVTIVVMSKGHVKAKIAVGTRATHTALTFRWKDKLPKGKYQWKVNAVDQAGNAQSSVQANNLTVR